MTVRRFDRLEDLPESPPDDVDYVVVDVIISSTAIVRLLEQGAEYVKPLADIDDAREFRSSTEGAVLVGEQGGAPVDGFDYLPLPSVFGKDDIEGARVGMVTTNGTRAVERIGADKSVFVASTVNARAVASQLSERDREAWLVAAGRYGQPTPEDTAGTALVERHYDGEADDDFAENLRDDVRGSDTAGWIRDIGLGEEIEAVLDFDSTETVPRMRDGVFVD